MNQKCKMVNNKKFHYIYKTVNLLTGQFYIGMHSTNNLNDGYMGSGVNLMKSMKHYGKENFKTEILEFLDDRDKLSRREKEIVCEALLDDPKCLNLATGGYGGWSNNPNSISILKDPEVRARAARRATETKKIRRLNETYSTNYNRKISEGRRRYIKQFGHTWVGRHHSEETKKLMSESNIGKHTKEKNSQFGTCWINNGVVNKKIKREDLEIFISDGWVKGRKMNL